MIGETHPGIGQIGDRLAVKRAPLPEGVERHAGQGEPARRLEEVLEPRPRTLTRSDKLMNDHQQPLSQRVVSFRTPENIELAFALAGPGSRAAAYFLDLMVMMVLTQILMNLLAFAFMML